MGPETALPSPPRAAGGRRPSLAVELEPRVKVAIVLGRGWRPAATPRGSETSVAARPLGHGPALIHGLVTVDGPLSPARESPTRLELSQDRPLLPHLARLTHAKSLVNHWDVNPRHPSLSKTSPPVYS